MKTFKNKKTGVLEHVTNEKLLAQYLKYTEVYELVDKKAVKEPTLNKKDRELLLYLLSSFSFLLWDFHFFDY